VSDADAVEAWAASLATPDILVNNAGIGHVGNLTSTTAADLDRMHAVNVRGPFNFCHAFGPGMLARGSGSVINIASVGGIVAVRERLAYNATKFAVVGLTKAMALDHSHTGVRFNAICPGRVETPFVKARIAEYPDPEQAYRDMASTQLNGRLAQPREIAAAAVYLASDVSTMVTGSTLMVDGEDGQPVFRAPWGVRLSTPVHGPGFTAFVASVGTAGAAVATGIRGAPVLRVEPRG
jgi:NAD(P)-dependent dehydrogenase (short-subunit alcohol dehydrogenase family)